MIGSTDCALLLHPTGIKLDGSTSIDLLLPLSIALHADASRPKSIKTTKFLSLFAPTISSQKNDSQYLLHKIQVTQLLKLILQATKCFQRPISPCQTSSKFEDGSQLASQFTL